MMTTNLPVLPPPVSAASLITQYARVIEDRVNGITRHINSPWPTLDCNLRGWLSPGRLIVVAARPQMGKSAFAQQVAEAVAGYGKSALIFSLEMSALDIIERAIARRARIGIDDFQTRGQFDEATMRAVADAADAVQQLPLFFHDAMFEIGNIVTAARSEARHRSDLGCIVVDYVQLVEAAGPNRNYQVAAISRGLKRLSAELHVPVIALSQLSRGVERKHNKRPTMPDLRDSGALEQDADLVLFLYRDDYYRNEKARVPGVAEIICGKNRHGSRTLTELRFDHRFGEFSDSHIEVDDDRIH